MLQGMELKVFGDFGKIAKDFRLYCPSVSLSLSFSFSSRPKVQQLVAML